MRQFHSCCAQCQHLFKNVYKLILAHTHRCVNFIQNFFQARRPGGKLFIVLHVVYIVLCIAQRLTHGARRIYHLSQQFAASDCFGHHLPIIDNTDVIEIQRTDCPHKHLFLYAFITFLPCLTGAVLKRRHNTGLLIKLLGVVRIGLVVWGNPLGQPPVAIYIRVKPFAFRLEFDGPGYCFLKNLLYQRIRQQLLFLLLIRKVAHPGNSRKCRRNIINIVYIIYIIGVCCNAKFIQFS
ncbi:hypothetical protein ES703_105527 [subsurface metagenome]